MPGLFFRLEAGRGGRIVTARSSPTPKAQTIEGLRGWGRPSWWSVGNIAEPDTAGPVASAATAGRLRRAVLYHGGGRDATLITDDRIATGRPRCSGSWSTPRHPRSAGLVLLVSSGFGLPGQGAYAANANDLRTGAAPRACRSARLRGEVGQCHVLAEAKS